MRIQFIKSNEKRRIIEKLNEYFGITEIPFLFIESGKEKIRGYSGHLSKEEITKLSEMLTIELMGGYILRRESEDDIRLSFDACILLQNQISKSIIEIDDSQFDSWIRGEDVEINSRSGNLIVKYKDDFVGCGKSNGTKLFNYVPKDRRLKSKKPNLDLS